MVKGAAPSDLSTLWSSHSRWPGAPSWASSLSSDTAEPWCAISLTLHRWLLRCLSPAAAANGMAQITWPQDSNSEMGEEESAVQCPNGAEMMLNNSAPSPVVWQCLTMSLQKSCPRNGTLSPPIYTLSWGGKNHLLKINHKSQKKKKKINPEVPNASLRTSLKPCAANLYQWKSKQFLET